MEEINRQALRVPEALRQRGRRVGQDHSRSRNRNTSSVDKKLYDKRKGSSSTPAEPSTVPRLPKGQELDDHYFGAIKPRVAAFPSKDLNVELWKLGILAKSSTPNNEVAPAQHEMAPIFSTTNIAADSNQLTMEIMQKVAKKHDVICLLHEKPFAGVNEEDRQAQYTGQARPTPESTSSSRATHRMRTLSSWTLFLCAVIKAVDGYRDLLRRSGSVTSANDHRLGANEAPPAIVSMFIGTDLAGITRGCRDRQALRRQGEGNPQNRRSHPSEDCPKDTTDRKQNLAVRLHRQQVRVQNARFVRLDLLREHRSQYLGRGRAEAVRRRARGQGEVRERSA